MPSARRFVDTFTDSSSDDEGADVEATDTQIMEILRTHLKRKKFRKKMRVASDVRIIFIPFLNAIFRC